MKKIALLILVLCLSKANFCQWVQGGIGWEVENTTTPNIFPCDENHLWALGYTVLYPTTIYYKMMRSYARSLDGGASWNIHEMNAPNNYARQLFCITNFDTAWCRMGAFNTNEDSQLLLRTQDGGLSWQPQQPPWMTDTSKYISHMHFFDNLRGLAMGVWYAANPVNNTFLFFQTWDGGDTWLEVSQTNVPGSQDEQLTAYSVVDSLIWITTNKNRILKSSDWGGHWSFCLTPVPFYSGQSKPFFASPVYGVLRYQGTDTPYKLFETYDGGDSWAPIIYSGTFHGTSSSSTISWIPGTIQTFLSNDNQGCSYSLNGCHTWIDFPEFMNTPVSVVAFTDVNHGWAGGLNAQPNPTSTGFYRYTGTLVSLLAMNPLQGGLSIFPNPSFGAITLHLAGFEGQTVRLTVTNMNGQCLFKECFLQNHIQSERNYDFSFLTAGLYSVVIQGRDKSLTGRFVIMTK